MGKYDISHPEIPQLKGSLELPDEVEPTEKHFWEAAKSVVRPYGLSQLSDEAKISAYKNGFFEGSGYNILDQEDDPSTPENEKQPGMLSMLGDAVTDLARKSSPIVSPYAKVMMIPEEPVAYQGKKLESQIREAGKIVFGLLDNNEVPRDIKNPLPMAMKQTGLPFENKVVQGMVKAAAMDYASDNAAVSLTGGVARAFQTAPFIAEGASKFFNEQTLDEDDDGDVLDFVNSSIAFDKVNYEYENAYDLAAFVLENPVDSLLAMGVGAVDAIAPVSDSLNEGLNIGEGANYDSQLQQDIRSGFQEPSPGLSIYGEVLGDPLNLAGGTLAKGLTFPQRAALSGKIKKTLVETQKLTAQATKLQKMSSKLPAESLVQQTLAKKMAEVVPKLAENQKILNKYGNSSLTSRLMGKSSPDALGKVARETFDQSTPGGRAAMAMAMDATSPKAKGGLLRTAAKAAGTITPEILGATAGGALLGVPGAIAGAALPTLVKGLRILSSMPENTAIRYIITGSRKAGQEINENEARQRYKNFKYAVTGTLGITSGIGYSFDQDAIGDKALIGAIATLFGPKILKQADAVARDARVIGSELIYGRTKEPFFRRVALLPTVDEGLEGALRDRFNILTKEGPSNVIGRAFDAAVQGTKAAYKEAVPTKAPFRVGQQGQQVGQNPFISATTKKTADILDSTGVGRYAETLGRFGTAMAGASALLASIGFLASGGEPEGAVTGAIISAPFTSLGAGYGMYQNYKTKADLYQKMLGDQEYYRDHLTKPERADFDRLPGSTRMMIAGYSMSHPDVVFTPSPKGAGSFNPVTMDITYNPNVPGSILKGALAHEVTHFIEMHGLMPTVNRILFGEALTGQSGLYASYGKNGEITYTSEFIKLRDIYMNRLREDSTVNADAVQKYEINPQLIGREIFADHGVDFLLSGKRDKALNQGPVGKLLSATMNAITGASFVRDFALKLNQPLDANGKFITTSDLFKGKLKKIPELEKLLTEYYKDVRGKSKQRIEGAEFKDPMTRRTIEKPGSRPIDDEFDVVYTVEDQKNPIVQEMLNTGGIYSTDKDGKINTDSKGSPMGMTKKERDRIERSAGDHAIKVFERNGIVVEEGPDGSKFVSDLRNLPENVIDELAAGPWHPKQIATLREVSRALREGDGERAGMLLGIFAASQFRKPKAVPFKVRSTLPYGFELTKQGNILVRLHDRDQLMTNLNFLKGDSQLPKDLVGMYDALFGSDDAVWKAFHDYRNNMEAGIDGKTGLDPDPVKAEKKLNFLNALHGAIDKAQVARNPVLSSIGYGLASSNRKNSPFGAATKTFRLDRIFTASRSGRGSGFNLERAKALMSPQDATLFIPTKEADASSIVEAVKINPNGFTMDLMARFPKGGFAVAPDKATEFVINQNKFDSDSLKDYLETHAKMFEREGAHLGGWLKDETGEYMLDVVFPLSYEDAVRHAMWGDQDSIFDLSTFTEIKTRNETTKQLQPPEGFSESFDQILRQKPRNIGEAAERSFRESSPIRDESIESIRRRAEGSQGEVREPPPPKTGREEVDGDLLLPLNDLTKFGAAQEVENSSGWLFQNGQFVRAPYSSHEAALGRFMDELPDSDPFKQKVTQAPGRTMTEKALSAGLMRVKKDGEDLYFQGNLTPKMKGFIEKAGIEHEVNAIHDNTARGSKDRSNTIYSPPQAEMADMFLPMDEQTHQQFQISTRNPTAGNRIDDPVSSNLVIGLDDILQTPGVAENYAKAINRYPGFKATRAKPEKVISRFVDMVMDNLLHLYDSVDPQIRERSKLWYVGARKIALEYAEKYGFSPQAVAATMAATSPQTDWYKNVDRARRILETVRNEQDTIFSEEMAAHTIKNASKTDKPTISAIANSIIGKPFKELNQIQQAYFIRSFDELNRGRTYQIISPEGEFIGPARKDDGEIDQYSWLSYNQITKALSALSDDSKANISNTMGEAHKIRNFYNNILLPFLDTDAVTIDTHAVAAGLLRPLASKDLEVYNMLGSKPKGKSFASIKNSTVAGVKGLYGIYAEAYRKAAKARGVLPREMQSITWEAIRGLYPKEIKQPKFKQQINDLFKSYENGKITIDELRTKVFKKAGGIDPPSWYGGGDPAGGNRPPSSGNSQASQSSSDKGELLLPFVRRLGASNRSGGVRNTTGSPPTNRVNQFMMPAAARAAVAQGETLERFRN